MVKFNNFVCIWLTFLYINPTCPLEFEKPEWFDTVNAPYKLVSGVVILIDELKIIAHGDQANSLKVIELFNKINIKLDGLHNKIDNMRQNVLDAVHNLKNFISFELEMNNFHKEAKQIKARYDRVKSMSRNITSFNNSTLRAFAEWNVIPGYDSISSKLFNVFFAYFGYAKNNKKRYIKTSLLEKIFAEFQYEESSSLCPVVSPQQYFYSDYLELMILEIKGYLINEFSWTILRRLGEHDIGMEEQDSTSEHQRRSFLINRKMRDVIRKASRELRICDPDEWKDKENYEQLTRLVQGYIVNEEEISNSASCSNNCETLHGAHYCLDGDCHNEVNIVNCEADSNKDFFTICPSLNPNRRYEYIETNRGFKDNNNFYGVRGKACQKPESLVKSWSRGVYKCSYCFCLVDERSQRSDRYFSLQEVGSDVEENKVVTGVRFVKKNQVMYLQIQQAKLAPFGFLKYDTLGWKDVEELNTKYLYKNPLCATFNSTWKTINLDDMQIQNSTYLVTGVKFSVMGGDNLYLRVRLTKYDVESGKLVPPAEWNGDTSKWIHNPFDHNYSHNRKKVPLRGDDANRGPKVSTQAPSKSIISNPRVFNAVEFTHSDKIDDASQTTVPFFDTQDVTSRMPSPLSGIGLYHKGLEGYGGFVALKIFTIDSSIYV